MSGWRYLKNKGNKQLINWTFVLTEHNIWAQSESILLKMKLVYLFTIYICIAGCMGKSVFYSSLDF